MNLTEPLPFERSKEDCAKCDTPATAKGGDATAKGGDDKAALLNKTKFAEDDFAIDSVARFDVDPEFVASLNLQEGGEVEFGESNDPANSMEAIKAELAGGETEGNVPAGALSEGEKAVGGCCDDEQTAEAKLQEMMAQKPEGAEATQKQGKPAQQGDIPANMKTIGPLSAGQRAKYMSHQMIQGVKQWFSANWPKLLAGAIAALAAFVGLNILTGGAIMAALPALMQVVGVVMGGVALANIAGHIGNYLSQGWAGNIGGAAKSLARGLAAGAVELVFALLFNAGAVIKAVKGGLKGTAKAAKGAVKNTVKTTVKSVKDLGQISAKGAKTAFKNGKIMLGGVKGGFAKGAKSLDDLAQRLVGKLRFNKFKIRLKGRRLQLWGKINPDILIAETETGKITEVEAGTPGAIKINVADDEVAAIRKGIMTDEQLVGAVNKGFANPGHMEELLKRTDIPKDRFVRLRANLSSALSSNNISSESLQGLISKLKSASNVDEFDQVLAELHHPNRLIHSGAVAKDTKIFTGAKAGREYDLGSVKVEIDPVPDADTLYLGKDGIIHLNEVKNTGNALRQKLQETPDQLRRMKEWRGKSGGDREIRVVIETESRWTQIFGADPGQKAALRTLIDEEVPLTIGSHNFSVAQMDKLWDAVLAKSKDMSKQRTFSNWNDFYNQMPTLKDAETFLGISL
jgi:hypothetical protein